jgi:tRNA pseudouridine55 synthase
MAEGVLPICVGKATRLIEFMDGADGTDGMDGAADVADAATEEGGTGGSAPDPCSKAYECEMRLGVTTDTLDIWGEALSVADAGRFRAAMTEELIRGVLASLTGDVGQVPPAYSAIKYKGRKLYEYARSGEGIPADAIRPRNVRIQKIEMLGMAFDPDGGEQGAPPPPERGPHGTGGGDAVGKGFATVRFSVVCSKGTYVRSIVRDAGEALGCGAAMSALTRTKSGVFTLADAHTQDEAVRAADENHLGRLMLPVDAAIPFMPKVDLDGVASGRFANGAPVRTEGGGAHAQRPFHVRVYGSGRFLGVGIHDGGTIGPCKVLPS